MNVIIKSGKKNWSGKEFSDLPAKIYTSLNEAVTALNGYVLYEFDTCEKEQKIEIILLTKDNEKKLLTDGKIRW